MVSERYTAIIKKNKRIYFSKSSDCRKKLHTFVALLLAGKACAWKGLLIDNRYQTIIQTYEGIG